MQGQREMSLSKARTFVIYLKCLISPFVSLSFFFAFFLRSLAVCFACFSLFFCFIVRSLRSEGMSTLLVAQLVFFDVALLLC